MEMSFYGVPQIELDSMRPAQVRKHLSSLLIAYLLVVSVSFFLPERVKTESLGVSR